MSDIDAIARMESDPNILIETAESAKTAARYAGDWIADTEAAITRVEQLHAPNDFHMLAAECDNGDCDHIDDDCPPVTVQQCGECSAIAESVSSFWEEEDAAIERAAWPCATIRALRGEDQ